MVLESKIYPNMKANIWYYVAAQWDGSTPLPVQIWGDGEFYTARRPDAYRVGAGQNQRSIEYDTVDGTYARYVLEEVLPEIGKQVKLRHDAYSRAMVGESSGAICAFNAAFHTPPAEPNIL
jgi:enterochelin esterase family protein